MECLKCGRETTNQEVFCTDCLSGMVKSPVSPNTPVVIHHRDETQRKAPVKKAPKPEDVIAGLNLKIRRLWAAVAVLTLLLLTALSALGFAAWAGGEDLDMGFNYSSVTYPSEGGRR